jgi:glycosyltransferase involved in cell wall biosynthesis
MELSSISVVMMYHNERANILRAVSSVIQQTHERVEAFIVDDGSTDGGYALVEELLEKTKKRKTWTIEHIRLEKNRGADFARDLAIGKCRGDYLALLAGDDFWCDRQYLKKAARAFTRYPQAAGFFARTRLVAGPKEREVGLVGWAPQEGWNSAETCREAFFGYKLNIPGSSFVFRRDLLEKLGGFSAELGGQSDTFANHAMAMQYGVIYSKDKVTVMELAADTISANQTFAQWSSRMALLENRLKGLGLLNPLSQETLDRWRKRRVNEFVSSAPIAAAWVPVSHALEVALGKGGHQKLVRDFLLKIKNQAGHELEHLAGQEAKVLQSWIAKLDA